VENFDKTMQTCAELIVQVEEIREEIAEPWGKLLCQSGAIVLKRPSALSSVMGLLFQAARDCNVSIDKVVKITAGSPYVTLELPDVKSSDDLVATKDCVVNLGTAIYNLKDKAEKLQTSVTDLFNQVSEGASGWFDAFKEKAGGLLEMKPYMEKLNGNRKNIQAAFTMIKELVDLIGKFPADLGTLVMSMKNEVEMKKFYELTEKIREETKKDKEKNKSNRHLYWNYTIEEKFGKFEDMHPFWLKITGEVYKEKGPVKVVPKPETKKEEKKDDKKDEKKDKDDKKDKKDDKDDKKDKKDKDDKDDKKEGGKKYKALQSQIDQLMKTVNDLKDQLGKKPSNTAGETVYVHKHSALKNWNLSLMNSFELEGSGNWAKSICLNYEKDLVVVGTKRGHVMTYKLPSWELVDTFPLHTGAVNSVTYLHDGKSVVSAGKDGKLFKINLETKNSEEFKSSLRKVSSITHAGDGATIYITSESGLYTYCTKTLAPLENQKMTFESEIKKVVYLRDTRQVAIALSNGTVKVVDPKTKTEVAEFKEHAEKVYDLVAIKYKGAPALATCSKDNTMHIYGLDDKTVIRKLKTISKSSHPSHRIFYGHDEKTLISLHEDGKIILNNFNSGDLTQEHQNKAFGTGNEKVSVGFYCNDGNTLVVGLKSGKIEVYTAK